MQPDVPVTLQESLLLPETNQGQRQRQGPVLQRPA